MLMEGDCADTDILKTLADNLLLLPSQERVLSPLAGILSAPDGQPPMLVEGALDLLAALLRPSGPEGASRVHAVASPTTLALLAASDDNGILQSACEYWR